MDNTSVLMTAIDPIYSRVTENYCIRCTPAVWTRPARASSPTRGFSSVFSQSGRTLVVVDKDGTVEQLPVPKPKKVKAFDAKRGLILSEEDRFLGKDSKGNHDWQTRYVQRRIPAELLAEIHRKGGL